MTLSPKERFDLERLPPEEVAAQPRTAEAFDFWFTKSRYARDWGKLEARLRVAKLAVPEARTTILQPFVDRKPSRAKFTTAHVAAVLDSAEVLDLALERKDDLGKLWERRTCLGLAAEMGHAQMVEALLEAGAPRLVPGGIDPLSLGKNHPAVVELLSADGLSADQLQVLLKAAAHEGNREEIRRLASQLEEFPPELFLSCKDEATAVFVLETLPRLGADRVCAATGGESVTLADAILARGRVRAMDIASHGARMSEDGLLRLVSACEKVGGRLPKDSPHSSLIDLMAARSKLRVVEALEARGAKVSAKARRRLLEDPSVSSRMRLHLTGDAPRSHAEFLRTPAAEGFEGRFSDGRFFGLALGEPTPATKLPDVDVQSREGRITEIRYKRYDIPGDAFEAISRALSNEYGPPTTEADRHHVWRGAQRHVSLRNETHDAGQLTSLVVREQQAPASPEALAAAFEGHFPELEAAEFRPKGTGFEVAADLRDRDACIVVSWPTNPMDGDSLDSQFVDSVLAELREIEEEERY